jgi:hypothetical protein
MMPKWTRRNSAIGYFGLLPTGAIQTFRLDALPGRRFLCVCFEKQRVQAWGVFLYVRQSLFDFLGKTAQRRDKAGRFAGLAEVRIHAG